MKIFVTGGTGFIGCHFLNQAHAAGHEIIALKRKGSSPRIPLETEPRWLVKNMADVEEEDFKGVQAVVHLAAHSVNIPQDNHWGECVRWNVWEPCALFEKAIASGVRRFLVAGSCFEYGKAGERYDFIPPDAPLEPTLAYSASKAAASIVFSGLAREKKLELLICRLFQVFGEGEAETRLWPSLRQAALSGKNLPLTPGQQVRDFISVEDVAKILVHNLDRADLAPGNPVTENIGSGHPQTVREFAEQWWQHWNAEGQLLIGALPYRDHEVMRYVPQIHGKGIL